MTTRKSSRRRRNTSVAALIAAVLSALFYQWQSSRQAESPTSDAAQSVSKERRSSESFDFYLMAYSLHPAFCEDGNARRKDCAAWTAADNERRPIVIHGLWPENDRPGSYPRDCAGPRLDLPRELRTELGEWMPGTASGLHSHEWRKHGTCSGLDAPLYYRLSIDLVKDVNAAVGDVLRANAERRISGAELRAAANAFRPGYGDTLTFHCRNVKSSDPAKRGRPYLYEIRQCIDNDGAAGAPATLLACPSVKRRDQGCGAQFWIDGV